MKKFNSFSVISHIVSSIATILILFIISLITEDLYFEKYSILILTGLVIYFVMKLINFLISPLLNHFAKIIEDTKKEEKDILFYLIIGLAHIAMKGIQIVFGILILLGLDVLFANSFNILNIWIYILIAVIISPTYNIKEVIKVKS